MTDRHDTEHVASALSDGTLRFLALTVMEADPKSRRLLCLEEPENGMHPLRIPAVIELLIDLAVDVDLPVDADNPLRQVIINTHSPSVVARVQDDALIVARAIQITRGDTGGMHLALRFLPETWRHGVAHNDTTVTRGDLLAYLNPFGMIETGDRARGALGPARPVMSRADMQMLLPLSSTADSGL